MEQLNKGVIETFKQFFHFVEKFLNVEKAMQHKVFENEEIKNMFTALGVSIGTEEDPRALKLIKNQIS